MSPTRRTITAAGLSLGFAALAGVGRAQARRPGLIIARGGAAGGWPAGSRGAYDQAANDGADFFESGVVSTKDGVLIARQDDELSVDTNIASRPEYAERRTTRVIDGDTREGWFCEDFTLPEIKSLTLAFPGGQDRRPAAMKSEQPVILTFDELTATARKASVRTARVVGVYASLVAPKYFARLDLPLEQNLARAIGAAGYNSPAAAMFVASDDADSLQALGELTRARRVRRWLPGPNVSPPEDPKAAAGGARAIAPPASWVLDAADPKSLKVGGLVEAAHGAGLAVHVWVFGAGDAFGPPLKPGDSRRALTALFAGDVDGVCVDLAGPAARARSDAAKGR
ncbi:MAG TPA: glycerophosphodiester phosphodiesterase family protein [Caulobacteraceae bacterium]|nr:glycerophosphodiester phosphodiesterase family protein [Caulobacteraceae bacterium]